MENQNNTFDPNTFDWEEYDRQSELEIKKLMALEKQIEEERQKEHELVSKMTDNERKQYLNEKYERVNNYALESQLNTKNLEPKKKGD